MAVDQARRDSCAAGIDDGAGAFGIDVLGPADCRDRSVFRNNGIRIEDRLLHGPAQQQPDIADNHLARTGSLGFIVGHRFFLCDQCLPRRSGSILRAA